MNEAPDRKLLAQAVDAYEFRGAGLGDIEHLVDFYHDYFEASYLPGLGLAYDPKKAWATLFRDISRGNVPQLIAITKDSHKLVGAISYNMNHDFTTEPFATLDKFYVLKPWRRGPIARVLLTLCIEVAHADGAVAFNAMLNSGMVETASAKNLLIKMGFETLDGVMLTRRL